MSRPHHDSYWATLLGACSCARTQAAHPSKCRRFAIVAEHGILPLCQVPVHQLCSSPRAHGHAHASTESAASGLVLRP
eukprot:4063207-Pleurochrysis_carterae.AAC.1